MIVSRKWLNTVLSLENITDTEIFNAFNELGFEVEKMWNHAKQNTRIIVGEIVSFSKIPDFDRLKECRVNVGQEGVLSIICGASNFKEYDKVIVALVGAELANGTQIVTRNFKNIISTGMLCSLAELGIKDELIATSEQKNIVILPKDALVGHLNPMSYLDLDDTLFELDITLNRSDCLGAYSLARDLGNYFGLELRPLIVENSNIEISNTEKQITINTKNITQLAMLKLNLLNKIPQTPQEVVRFLQKCGIKPVNLVEDVTNMVMLELGQPLACFTGVSHLKLVQSPIAYPESTLKISIGDFLLYAKDEMVSLIGNVKNQDYNVTENTSSLTFISLNGTYYLFDQQWKRHIKYPSLLIQRLSRPVPTYNYLNALKRVIYLLDKYGCNFHIVKFTDELNVAQSTAPIPLTLEFVNNYLGLNLDLNILIEILQGVGCVIETNKEDINTLLVMPPMFRNDLQFAVDLIEEVARIFGYDNIPSTEPHFYNLLSSKTPMQKALAKVNHFLLNNNCHQVKIYNLTNRKNEAQFNYFSYKNAVVVKNPLSINREMMTLSLINPLLEIALENSNHKMENINIFTQEKIYTLDNYQGNNHLGVLLTGDLVSATVEIDALPVKFGVVKGLFQAIIRELIGPKPLPQLVYQKTNCKELNKNLALEVFYENKKVAVFGEVHPKLIQDLKFNIEDVFILEINLEQLKAAIIAHHEQTPIFHPWSKFNAVSRDITFILEDRYTYGDVEKEILNLKLETLQKITPIKEYRNEYSTLNQNRALTLNFVFNNHHEQLREDELNGALGKIIDKLKEKFKSVIK